MTLLTLSATLLLAQLINTLPTPDDSGNGASSIAAGGAGADPTTPQSASQVGAGGSSQSTASLSTGGIVAIAVVCFFVVLALIFTGTLWYQAKKRSWTMKEGMIAGSRKVAAAVATPLSAVFPKSPGLQKMKSITSLNSEFDERASLRRQNSGDPKMGSRSNSFGMAKKGSSSKMRNMTSHEGEVEQYPFPVDADEKIRGLKAQEEARAREKGMPRK